MYYRTLIALLLSVLMMDSCKKEKPDFFATDVDLETLYFHPDSFLCSATKEIPGFGSMSWTANCAAGKKEDKFGIGFITYESEANLYARERLTIGNIPAHTGLYELEPIELGLVGGSFSRWVADGDVLNASWNIDQEQNNTIEIIEINEEARIIRGKFDVHFIMTQQGSFGLVHSEKINFKNGSFVVRYTE